MQATKLHCFFFLLVNASHIMTNTWSTLLPRDLRHRQDHHQFGDDYTIEQTRPPEYIASSSVDDVSFPPVGYPQGAGLVNVPSGIANGSRVLPMVSPLLNQAPTSAPTYQESASGSLYAQANYSASTPSTSYSDQNGRGSIDYTSDINAYPSITPSSLNFAAGWRSQDNGGAPQFGEPPFIHSVTSLALHGRPYHRPDVSSWSASPNPAMPSVPGTHPSDFPDNQNFPMPLGRTTNSDRFTGQPYLPPSKPTPAASTPVRPYDQFYAFPIPPPDPIRVPRR